MTTMGLSPIFSAFDTTNLVCGKRALGGVHQHQCAVDHIENAFDLAAEIGVARRVHDIDAGVFPHHRGSLGQDGNATLALEVIGIHGALDHALVLADTRRIAAAAGRPRSSCRGRRAR